MFKIEEATIDSIQKAISTKEISYKELILMYMERIAKIDSCKGGLKSVIEINPYALESAGLMDNSKDMLRGFLYGIPILVKDNVAGSAGSLALTGIHPYSEIINNLHSSGAIALGTTNMTELANWMSFEMPSGYSSRGGQVINPYNREADPSGSSSGSAVAVAANLCVASIGTETCGSINSPAAANGIVGIKPTAGLLSTVGIVPISTTLDTPGPMARTVKDAAILLGGLHRTQLDYVSGLESSSLQGLRIGVYGKKDSKEEEYNDAFDKALLELERAGAIIAVEIPEIEEPWYSFGEAIGLHEFKRAINNYLLNTTGKVKSLKDIIEFNEKNKETCLKYGQSILTKCQDNYSGNLVEPEYINALRTRENAIQQLDKGFLDNSLDIIVSATEMQDIAPLTGFPSGTFPFGKRKNNLPMGMYFMARRYNDVGLIRAMYAAERLIGKRQSP